MFECQLRSMQSQASNWIGATSIGLVTNNWMPLLGQMHSNLVLASRLKLYLCQSPMCRALQNLDVGDGSLSLAAILRRVASVYAILGKV